jgi:hypothetical protein
MFREMVEGAYAMPEAAPGDIGLQRRAEHGRVSAD